MKTQVVNHQDLIQNGETLAVEFKSDRKVLSDNDIYNYCVGLANTQGGYLLIGVEDNGKISGLHKDRINKPEWFNKIKSAIRNNTQPNLNVNCQKIDSENIFIIEVPAASGTIYSNTKGVCYQRVLGFKGPENIPMQLHHKISRLSTIGQYDASIQVFPDANFNDLDPIEFMKIRKLIQKNSPNSTLLALSDEDMAIGLDFVRTNEDDDIITPTLLGLLMVGKEQSIQRLIPTHEVAFQVTDHLLNVKVNKFYKKSLVSILEEVETLFEAQNMEKEINVGFQRIAIPDYSPNAFREAFLNALIHRDYSINQAIYIQLSPDQLRITNPGGFVEGINQDNFLTHEPKPRNPQLAHACQRIGLVERLGRGIDKIFIEQLRIGRNIPDYSTSNNEAVRVILYGGEVNLKFAQFVIENEINILGDLLILYFLQESKRIDVKETSKLIQKSDRKAKQLLENLVSKNFIEAKGEKSGRVYTLSSWVYKGLEIPEEYIHTRGIEPIHHETMVLQYLEKYGSIKRTDIETLCHLKRSAASNFIKKLVDKGVLKRIGNGKNISYLKND